MKPSATELADMVCNKWVSGTVAIPDSGRFRPDSRCRSLSSPYISRKGNCVSLSRALLSKWCAFARLFGWRPHGFGCRTFQRSSAFVPGRLPVYHVPAGFRRVRNSGSSRQLWYAYSLFHIECHARALLCNRVGRHDSRVPADDLVVISPHVARPSFRCRVPRSARSTPSVRR